MTRTRWKHGLGLATTVSLVAAAGGAAGAGAPSVLEGNDNCSSDAGVTDDSIKIGVIGGQSGPVAGAGIPIIGQIEVYWELVNEAGGIDGRTVELDIRDDQYLPDRTVLEFRELEPEALAVTAFGTPGIAATAQQAQAACMVIMGNATSGGVTLAGETVFTGVTATEYELINLVDWWVNEQGHTAPKIGVAYEDTATGQGVLSATQYAAEQFGATVVAEAAFAPTDTSFTGQIAALQQADADVVVVGAGYASAFGFIAQAAEASPEWTFLGPHSLFVRDGFDLPVGEIYEDRVYIGDGGMPNYADGGASQEVGDLLHEHNPALGSGDSLAAWLSQELLHAAILEAAENDDLTRGGVLAALSTLEHPSSFFPDVTQSFGTDDVFPRAPTVGSGIYIADRDSPSGKRTVVPYFISEASAGFEP